MGLIVKFILQHLWKLTRYSLSLPYLLTHQFMKIGRRSPPVFRKFSKTAIILENFRFVLFKAYVRRLPSYVWKTYQDFHFDHSLLFPTISRNVLKLPTQVKIMSSMYSEYYSNSNQGTIYPVTKCPDKDSKTSYKRFSYRCICSDLTSLQGIAKFP